MALSKLKKMIVDDLDGEEEEEVEDWTAEWVTWGHRNITFDFGKLSV